MASLFDTFDAHFSGGSVFVFRGPVLNDAGQVAFRADLTGSGVNSANSVGVWSEGSGNLGLVARTGSAAPGGGTFGAVSDVELFSPNLNDAGQTAFWGGLTNGNMGIWSEGSGSLGLVARESTLAPGIPNGVSFWFAGLIPNLAPTVINLPPLLNNAGHSAFVAPLKGAGITDTNNTGIWSQGPGNLTLLARRGSQAAEVPNGVNYDFGHFTFALNDAGQNAFTSALDGSGVDDTNFSGYWVGVPGDVALIERMGDPAPGTPPGVNFGTLFGSHGFNNAGQIAIGGPLTGDVDETNDEGLWSNVSGSLELVARKGSQAAGTPAGVNYGTFSRSGWPVLNDAGQIAFISELAGAGVNDSNDEAIWTGFADDLALVARTGDPAPHTSIGVNFSDLDYPSLNSRGQVAFRGELVGDGIDPTNNKGIWATDRTGMLLLVARSGEPLEVAPGDFRTLEDLNFSTASGNSDGRPSGFNNVGELVFWASFTDGSQGVFISNAVTQLPGDFDGDCDVDGRDFLAWQRNPNVGDIAEWQAHYGTGAIETAAVGVPEPGSACLVAILTVASGGVFCRLCRQQTPQSRSKRHRSAQGDPDELPAVWSSQSESCWRGRFPSASGWSCGVCRVDQSQ